MRRRNPRTHAGTRGPAGSGDDSADLAEVRAYRRRRPYRGACRPRGLTRRAFDMGPAEALLALVFAALATTASSVELPAQGTLGPNLLFNGDFDNHVWYERYRGWSPSGWYQWFTRGGHAPEHAVGKRLPHSGKEYVRIHMWAYAWRGGVLQNVRGVEPCHVYRLTAHGFFQPPDAPEPNVRIGLDTCGTLADQFSADVSKHPASRYDEGVGDDPKTDENEGHDVEATTVWSATKDVYAWEPFEVTAEARSDTVTVILCCDPKQRPDDQPIYEMNWDTVALREVPWPTARLVAADAVLAPDDRFSDLQVQIHPRQSTCEVTWATKVPAGASQVLYRLLDEAAVGRWEAEGENAAAALSSADLSAASPVVYERGARRHWIQLAGFLPTPGAIELQVIALSRALIDGECTTLASPVKRVPLTRR